MGVCGSKFSKKHQFFQFKISLPQASKPKETYILPLGKDFKNLKDIIIHYHVRFYCLVED